MLNWETEKAKLYEKKYIYIYIYYINCMIILKQNISECYNLKYNDYLIL